MRVLHLTSSFPRYPGDHNAPYLAELVAAQRAAGIEPMVVAPHGPGVETDSTMDGTPVHRFRYAPARAEVLAYRGGLLSTATRPAGAVALAPFGAAFALAGTRWARRWEADVVHAHWWLPGGMVAVRAGAATGAAVVITCHGSDVPLARRPGVRGLARAVLGRADVVAAVSEALACDLAALVPGRAPIVLPMPFGSPPRDRVPGPSDPPLQLLAVGRLMPEKGFDLLVAAVAVLAKEGRDVRLRIVGGGPLRDLLLEQTRVAAVGGIVSLDGPVPPERLGDAIDGSHAVVIPSRREGLGLVALEALDRGRAVVAAAVGGLPETLLGRPLSGPVPADGLDTPSGILVRPGDVAALTRALRRLPRPDPPAPAAAHARHDPSRVAADHLRAYEAAVEVRRRRRSDR